MVSVLRLALALVALVAVPLGVLLMLVRDPLVPSSLAPFAKELKGLEASAPPSLLSSSSPSATSPSPYHFGRWKQPIRDLTHLEERGGEGLTLLGRARYLSLLKRWHYISIADARFFVAFAMVQLNYAAVAFVYLVDLEDPSVKYEYSTLAPLGAGLDFAPSSVRGCSQFSSSPLLHAEKKDISACFNETEGLYRIELDVPLTPHPNPRAAQGQAKAAGPRRLLLSAAVEPQEGLVLSYPLGGSPLRPAYTHKAAGMRANGVLRLDGEEHYLDGLAALDWTKSLARRETFWNWASVSGHASVSLVRAGGERRELGTAEFGINLSARVYDLDQASCENGLWVNHTVYPLGGARFHVPARPDTEPWRITSPPPAQGEAEGVLALSFEPMGTREERLNLGLLVSDFVQPFGYFSGKVTLRISPDEVMEVDIARAFGVVEDHHAVW